METTTTQRRMRLRVVREANIASNPRGYKLR
jgi:hypothetical protein